MSKECEHTFSNRVSVAKIQTKMCPFSVLSEVQFDTPMWQFHTFARTSKVKVVISSVAEGMEVLETSPGRAVEYGDTTLQEITHPYLGLWSLPSVHSPSTGVYLCSQIHMSGMFTAPGSLRAPHVKLSACPITAKWAKGGMFTPWDATHKEEWTTTARIEVDECHKGRISDTRLSTACQIAWWTSYTHHLIQSSTQDQDHELL